MTTALTITAVALLAVAAAALHRATLYRRFETTIKEIIVSEAQNVVDALTTQLGKASTEILGKIAELEAREPSVDFTDLKAAVQALDDIVPDPAPEPEPTPEPEPEPSPETTESTE